MVKKRIAVFKCSCILSRCHTPNLSWTPEMSKALLKYTAVAGYQGYSKQEARKGADEICSSSAWRASVFDRVLRESGGLLSSNVETKSSSALTSGVELWRGKPPIHHLLTFFQSRSVSVQLVKWVEEGRKGWSMTSHTIATTKVYKRMTNSIYVCT